MLNNYATIKLDRWGIIETTSAHKTRVEAVEHAKLMKRFHDVDLLIVDYSALVANNPCKHVYEGVGDVCEDIEANHDIDAVDDGRIRTHEFV